MPGMALIHSYALVGTETVAVPFAVEPDGSRRTVRFI